MPFSPIPGIKRLFKKKKQSSGLQAGQDGWDSTPPRHPASAWTTPGTYHLSPSPSLPGQSIPPAPRSSTRPLATPVGPSHHATNAPNAPYHQQAHEGHLPTPPERLKFSASLGDCLKTFNSPLRQPYKDPNPDVPSKLPVKRVMARLWDAALEMKTLDVDNPVQSKYIRLQKHDMTEVDGMVSDLFNELNKYHVPGLSQVLDFRHQGVQHTVRSGPLRNEWQLVGDEYADFVILASEVLGRLYPNQTPAPALQTEIQFVSTENDSKIDLGVAFRTKGLTATPRTIASTCEYKIEESFSDAALDAFDEFWSKKNSYGMFYEGSTSRQTDPDKRVFVTKAKHSVALWKDLTDEDRINKVLMAQRILVCAVQAVSYAYESHTIFGLFTNGNRHILVTYRPMGTDPRRPAVYISKSFGRRSDGTAVNPRPHGPHGGQSPPLLAYLLAIAHSNLTRDREAGAEMGVGPDHRPLPPTKDVHSQIKQHNGEMNDRVTGNWHRTHIQQRDETRPRRTMPPVNYSEDDTPGHTPVKHDAADTSFNFTPIGGGAGWTPPTGQMVGLSLQGSSAQTTSTGWMTSDRPSMLAGSMPPTPTPAPGGRPRPPAAAQTAMGGQARVAAAYAPGRHAAMGRPDHTYGTHGQRPTPPSRPQRSAYGQPRSQMQGMPSGYSQPRSTPTPPRTAGGHARTYGDSPRRR